MKYTMESRVYLEDPWIEFNTCGDLVAIFPDAFPKVNHENKYNSVNKNFDGNWYKLQWAGTVGEYTSYQITFTIKYSTMQQARLGQANMLYGEWSLRYWVPHGRKWEKDVVE